MTAVKLAVVILNWNGKNLLAQFLPTVLANSNLPTVRVVVADNASTDGSVDYLKANYPMIHLLELEKNYGFAVGYNMALALLDDDYFILLNSDAIPEKNWLEPFLNSISNNDGIEVAMPKIRSYKNPHQYEYAGACGGYIDRFGFPFCRGRILDVVEVDNGQYNDIAEVFWASGAALFIKADLYKQSGGLDEHFFAHMEEIDLCWRLKNQGHKVWVVPSSVVYHVGGASLHQSHPRKTFLNFRNNLFMLLKNLPARSLIPVLFVRMVLDGVAAFKFALSGEFKFGWAVFKAHLSFYRRLPLFLRKRKGLANLVTQTNHPQMYRGSIVFDFFIRRVRTFRQLSF
jgi:GT2 family glycosyltransferase